MEGNAKLLKERNLSRSLWGKSKKPLPLAFDFALLFFFLLSSLRYLFAASRWLQLNSNNFMIANEKVFGFLSVGQGEETIW